LWALAFRRGGGKTYQKYRFPVGQYKNGTGYRGRVAAGSLSLICSLTRKQTPKQPPTDCSHVHAPLEALKTVERVKGIEPSLSAWEAANEGFT